MTCEVKQVLESTRHPRDIPTGWRIGMRLLLLAMWVGWLVYWAIAERGTKATQWREPVSGLWLHNLLALLGTVVMAVPRATPAIFGAALPAAEPDRRLAGRRPHRTRPRNRRRGADLLSRRQLEHPGRDQRRPFPNSHAVPIVMSGTRFIGDSPRPARQRDRTRPLAGAFGLGPDLRGLWLKARHGSN